MTPLEPPWIALDAPGLRQRLLEIGLDEVLLQPYWRQQSEPETEAILEWHDGMIQLRPLAADLGNPVRVDFLHGKTGFRALRFQHEMIVKAVAGRSKDPMTVLDVTAGLGRDGFLLAAAGHNVTLIERNPAIACLLADGLFRAAADPEMAPVCARLRLQVGDARHYLASLDEAARPDVICIDPMFPERQKTALVKKEMRVFRQVVGEDIDADALLALALRSARRRVVVKRPRKAEPIGGHKPGYQLTGTSSRFDIYVV